MAKRKKTQKEVPARQPLFGDLSPHAKQAIAAVLIAVVGVFFLAALFEFGGLAGTYVNSWLIAFFGHGAYLAPLACAFYVFTLLHPNPDDNVSIPKIIGIALLFIASLGILYLYNEAAGGMVGYGVAGPLIFLFGTVVATVTCVAFFLIGIFLFFDIGLQLPSWIRRQSAPPEEEDTDDSDFVMDIPDTSESSTPPIDETPEDKDDDYEPNIITAAAQKLGVTRTANYMVSTFRGSYEPPSLSLLKKDTGKPQTGDVKANSVIIKRTLKEFGINVEMDGVEIGPTVTRYALKPAQGVKISRIVGLQQELQLNLSSNSLRIEAPIPGKSLVGIEIPNKTRSTIGLATLLKTPEFTDSPHPLLVALGKDVTGGVHYANIARMPHALIAGTTGSGKSIAIHNLIISLLFRNSPEQLRLLMVDPKRVELTLYEGIPHLLAPVIVDSKKALLMLKWAVKEMERRYDILQSEKIQNLDSYHTNVYQPAKKAWEEAGADEEAQAEIPEPLPYIVIIMDELADLMHAYPKELEASIVRLAQMSRAVGIHLLLATQRPSVNIITGTIKANIPTRLALNVASQIDSRTILDQVGAEKLLGKGDMLYSSNDAPLPIRLQSAFVSEEEVKKVVEYLKNQVSAATLDAIPLDEKSGGNGDSFSQFINEDESEDEDELYEEAKRVVIEGKKASTSFLQRRLRIGYSRAARLIDIMEERGVIGPGEGSKPRTILVESVEEDSHYQQNDTEEDTQR
jgi:DNA segregation ATPase FtsK/SpoIIIE, S-DNA-T family